MHPVPRRSLLLGRQRAERLPVLVFLAVIRAGTRISQQSLPILVVAEPRLEHLRVRVARVAEHACHVVLFAADVAAAGHGRQGNGCELLVVGRELVPPRGGSFWRTRGLRGQVRAQRL